MSHEQASNPNDKEDLNNEITAEKISAEKTRSNCIKRIVCYILMSLLGVLLLMILGIGGYLYWFFNHRTVPPPPDFNLIKPHVKNGDVLLRYGVGIWSELFRVSNSYDKRFSHVGIVVEVSEGNFVVVHAEGSDISGQGAVWVEPFDQYVKRSIAIGIGRPHIVSGDQLAEKVQTFIGQPFDCFFNNKDHSKIYCTELVDLSLKAINPELALPVDGFLIKPEACMDPKYFTEIPLPVSTVNK